MSKFALQARWVVPVASPPIAGGVVTIENDRITAVGQQPDGDAAVEDLGDVVLLPGLVNAHTHLEFSQLTAPLGQPGMPLPDWIRLVIGSRKQHADSSAAIAQGLHESFSAGVTSIGEISTSPLANAPQNALPQMVAFHEVIGFSAARADSVFADVEQRLDAAPVGCLQGISPHAPYTVHPRLLERLVELAVRRQLPVAMHLAESREELQLLADNAGPFRELLEDRSMWDSSVFAGGKRPLDYLHVLSAAPRALVVHGNYLSADEIEYIAQRRDRMSLVYCPRTHAYFSHEPYPLPAMLAAGACVAVGTDSRASNPDLCLLSELRTIARTFPNIAPAQILEMGTRNGAAALGLSPQTGSLAPGKRANLTAIPCAIGEQSPVEFVVCGDQRVSRTWVAMCGNVVSL